MPGGTRFFIAPELNRFRIVSNGVNIVAWCMLSECPEQVARDWQSFVQ